MLKKDETMLIKALQVSRDELFALAKLINQEPPTDNINSLLDIIGENAKKNSFQLTPYLSQRRKKQA